VNRVAYFGSPVASPHALFPGVAGPFVLALTAVCLMLETSGLRFSLSQVSSLSAWLAVSFILVCMRDRFGEGRLRRLIDCSEALSVFSAVSAIGAVASYAVAALSKGYVDAPLAHADAALGLDWVAMCRFAVKHPGVELFARWAYAAIFLLPVFILVGLCLTGRAEHARRFIKAYAAALAITIFFFFFFPAAGPVAFYGDVPLHFHSAARHQAEVIEALRGGALKHFELGEIGGLVSVPSFHAVCAVLFSWAAWPLRRLRWPILLVNFLMLCATPLEGNHYFVDLIGGVALAVIAILWAHGPPTWKVPTVVPDIPVIHRVLPKFFASPTRRRSAWSLSDRGSGPSLSGRPATARRCGR
jgi:PAP2 superfamily